MPPYHNTAEGLPTASHLMHVGYICRSHFNPKGEYLPRCARGACAVRVLGLLRDPFIQSQSGGMVMPQSPPGTIYNSSPGRPSPGEVVHT